MSQPVVAPAHRLCQNYVASQRITTIYRKGTCIATYRPCSTQVNQRCKVAPLSQLLFWCCSGTPLMLPTREVIFHTRLRAWLLKFVLLISSWVSIATFLFFENLCTTVKFVSTWHQGIENVKILNNWITASTFLIQFWGTTCKKI